MPAPNASVGINRFIGWSADTMAETPRGFSAPNVDVAMITRRAVEMMMPLRSHFLSRKAPSSHLFTAGYLAVDGQK